VYAQTLVIDIKHSLFISWVRMKGIVTQLKGDIDQYDHQRWYHEDG